MRSCVSRALQFARPFLLLPTSPLSLVYRVIAFRLASKYCSLGHDNKAACPNPQHPLQQSSARCSHTFLLCLCFSFSIDKINYTIICHAPPQTHTFSFPCSLSLSLCLSLSVSVSVSLCHCVARWRLYCLPLFTTFNQIKLTNNYPHTCHASIGHHLTPRPCI